MGGVVKVYGLQGMRCTIKAALKNNGGVECWFSSCPRRINGGDEDIG